MLGSGPSSPGVTSTVPTAVPVSDSPGRRSSSRLPVLFRLLFWITALVVLASYVDLARQNLTPGTPDSINNLATARNIASGRGFTSQVVHQFYDYQPVPNPESVRPPGLPYLLALCFRLLGVNLILPVFLNGLFLVGTALCVRSGLRRLGVGVVADVAGVLAMLTSCFQPAFVWNNNALVFSTALLFWVGALRLAGGISVTAFALLAGTVGAAGFLVKQTFLFTALPSSLLLVLFPSVDPGVPPRRWLERLRPAALLVATFLALSSPYWIRNLVLFGNALYNPMRFLRVVARYGGEDGYGMFESGTWRTVRLGKPLTLGELVEAAGLRWVVQRELKVLFLGVASILKANPFVTGLALLPLLGWRRDTWRPYLFVLLLLGESVFSLFYISVSPRYLWSAHPCLLALAALGVDRLLSVPRQEIRAPLAAWLRVGVWLLLGLALWHGARDGLRVMRDARRPELASQAPWIDAVTRSVSPDAVVLSDNPWGVWWYADRSSVMAPTSSREGLLQVLQLYHPTHFLYVNKYKGLGGSPPFEPEELFRLATGSEPVPWALYRIRPQVFDVEVPEEIPAPPLRPH